MVKNHFLLIVSLFYFILSTPLSARADVYLATGVLTTKKATRIALAALRADLIKSNPELYKSQAFKSAYNTSHSWWDFIESATQLFNQNGWSEYWNIFVTHTGLAIAQYYIDYFSGVSETHDTDLSEQIAAYKSSISAGNQVIVIAHSQGNYFTNEAYAALSECQKKSFYMLGVANPASKVSGADNGRGVLLTLDNDPITYVPSSMSPNVINGERSILAGVDFKK